ncbi:MAG: 2-phospho-L-lactate guanylyltransferase [Steroidobacteraceae bacterium]
MSECWAIVPVKRLAMAKTRLSGVLSPAERQALSAAMLSDVLDALRATPAIAGTLVVTPDSAVADAAACCGAVVFAEPTDAGLEPRLQAAAAVQAGIAAARSRGATHALYLPGDVPLVDPAVLGRVLAAGGAGGCIVRALRDDGTNTVLCDARHPIDFDFGPGSCTRHRRAAAARGITLKLVAEPALALDIDVPEDLERLRFESPHGETARWLHGDAARAVGAATQVTTTAA